MSTALAVADAGADAVPDALERLLASGRAEGCAPWPRMLLDEAGWRGLVAGLARAPQIALLALWADATTVHALLTDRAARTARIASVLVVGGRYPALSQQRAAAAWFERMVADLWGHRAEGGTDGRPWLDHGAWSRAAPLAAGVALPGRLREAPTFLPAEGNDLQVIPVGPVHAGIIEPGHFHFTTQGETVVRLEIRLGYVHKGTLGLMRGRSPRAAARFAARLSGDATVGHSIAFARAAEAATWTEAPPRAHALRAVMAELERLANHLGDCGAITGDAAFAQLPARFGWQRENILRASAAAFGHRLMMDCVVPGGTANDLRPDGPRAIAGALATLAAELPELQRVYDEHTGLADRMVTTGAVAPALAAAFAAGGYVGRAAGQEGDARRWPGYPPYDGLSFGVPLLDSGDADARVRVRLAEITESIGLLRQLLGALPDGPTLVPLPAISGEGLGWAETFRGDAWHWVRLEGGQVAAAFAADPSWRQWPLLEAAIEGNIVADFPICNKSFNCSYSGVDL